LDTFLSLLGLAAFFAVLGIVLAVAGGVLYLIARRLSERDQALAAERRASVDSHASGAEGAHSG
jgi:hypothetical protein